MDTSSSEDDTKKGRVSDDRIPSKISISNLENELKCAEDPSISVHNNGLFMNCDHDVSTKQNRETTSVKDIMQKLVSRQTPADETAAVKLQNFDRVEEMKGVISKAMEGLAKSQSHCGVLHGSTSKPLKLPGEMELSVMESETDLHWKQLLVTSQRALQLCDLDFSDLCSDDEYSVLAPSVNVNGVPPPPPPYGPFEISSLVPIFPKTNLNKGKKTVKLFWKEVQVDPSVLTKLKEKQLIWDEIYPVALDTEQLEYLFESKAKDLITRKQQELNKSRVIIVLDPKRSNAINIGMTKLPSPRSIETAILKMDSTVIGREGIEKLLTMLPTEEEIIKIQEAESLNPGLPLGSAEHFLLTLASITELTARLKLWAFKLNYENIEKEIADPLMDLKQGVEVLRTNKTFRAILSTLLSIGIFLNGIEVKGFQIEYLAKVPEVKDTVNKHSLLHHLCRIVMEKFPDSTDLYSEIGAITRASRIDFDELRHSILRVEQECKASFDHLKAITKYDDNTNMKKLSDFLADCAERIIVLRKVYRRVTNRFHTFCLWLGVPLHRVRETKPNELCKVISEFALEYRTMRERVIQLVKKRVSYRESNSMNGKIIIHRKKVDKLRGIKEDHRSTMLHQLLNEDTSTSHQNNTITNNFQGSLSWRRLRRDSSKNMIKRNIPKIHSRDTDDELMETLFRTATQIPIARNNPRDVTQTRHMNRKLSLQSLGL